MLKVALFQGIGDCFYQIPFVRALAKKHGEVAISTAYPNFFSHIPGVHFWYRPTMLKAHEKALASVPKHLWARIHKSAEPDIRLGYDHRDFANGLSILEQFNTYTPENTDFDMTLPLREEWLAVAEKIRDGRKIAVIRRPTTRREYNNGARNPKPGLIQVAINELLKRKITPILVGDIQAPHELAAENLTGVKESYESGELTIEQIAALSSIAQVTVTAVGYATPMCLSVKARCLTIFGGHVGPEYIYGPRADMSRHVYVAPTPFCNCFDMRHEGCNKEISHGQVLAGLDQALAME